MARLAALVLAYAAAYGVLLAASWQLGGLLAVERALAATASRVMPVAWQAPAEREVAVRQEGGLLRYELTVTAAGRTRAGTFSHPFHAQNLLLFAALVLATPGVALRSRAVALGAGLAVVFALDAFIVMGDFWLAERVSLSVPGAPASGLNVPYLASVLRWMHPTGGAFMLPVFVWALVLAGPLRKSLRRLWGATSA